MLFSLKTAYMKKIPFISAFMAIILALPFTAASQMAVSAQEETINEVTVPFRTRNNLLIVPFMINDTIKVNLILDPRCKTIILFGKRYKRWLRDKRRVSPENTLASESTPDGHPPHVSLHNKISIGPATGEDLPIVVVPNSSFFNFFTSVHGVIGADFLADYDVSVNHRAETITIRNSGNRTQITARSK
jgi:hypothetical protein